jgi:hypothetical protein
MKKIIFLLIIVFVIGYAWFGWYRPQLHKIFDNIAGEADNYIGKVRQGSDKVDQVFNQAGDKYLDGLMSQLNDQAKVKIVQWLKDNNKYSTTTASNIKDKTEDYKKLLQENPDLVEYLKTLQIK